MKNIKYIKYIKYIFILCILISVSCKNESNTEFGKNNLENEESGINVESFDEKQEKQRVDALIESNSLTLNKFLKYFNNSNLIKLNTNDNYSNYDWYESVEKAVEVYSENGNIVSIHFVFEGDDIGSVRKFYFKNKKNYAVEENSYNLADPTLTEQNYIVLFDTNFEKISETFETKNSNGEISDEKFELYNLENYKNIEEIISKLGLQEFYNSIKPDEPGYFQNQKLGNGEKIIKVEWGMENTTNFERDHSYNDENPRYSSKTMRVPNGKVWILLYIDEYYLFENSFEIYNIPYLFVNNKTIEWSNYKRIFSEAHNIDVSKSKVENLIFYPGETIIGVSRDQKSKNLIEYKGWLWFLETTMDKEMEQKRLINEVKNLKEQNDIRRKQIEALESSKRAKKWKEEADRKMYR